MMSTERVLNYLKESFEKELSDIKAKMEAEKREIERTFQTEVEALEKSYSLREISALDEQKKELDNRQIPVLNEKRLILQSKLKQLINNKLKEVLASLRDHNYERVFHNLVREVPSINWKYVKINPEDRELALSYFPRAIIIEDEEIIGGFELISEDKKIFLSNSFEKRAERIRAELENDIFINVIKFLEKDKND